MAYEYRDLRRQRVLYNADNSNTPLRTALVVDGEKITPASATVTIYSYDGSSTALVSAQAATVTGTVITYSVSTTTTASWPVADGYRAEFTVTYGGDEYAVIVVFDVVKFLLRSPLTVDQLVDRDSQLRSAEWGGAESLAGLIEAARDELQIDVENVAFENQRAVDAMILDHGKFATVHRLKVLEMFWRGNDHEDKANYYERQFKSKWKAFVGQIKWDTSQSGIAQKEGTRRIMTRFRT